MLTEETADVTLYLTFEEYQTLMAALSIANGRAEDPATTRAGRLMVEIGELTEIPADPIMLIEMMDEREAAQ